MKIFITGVSSGIGRELATKLIKRGHEVWGVARRQELLNSLQADLNNPNFRVSRCDLVNRNDLEQTAQKMRQVNFLPDVIVLNAGDHIIDTGNGLDIEAFRKTFHLNVDGAMFWVSEFLPDFLTRKSGSVIAISSTSAYRPGIKSIAYPASKSALSMAFRGLRLKYSGTGVKFTTIHFGPIKTRLWAGSKSFLIRPAREAADFIISAFSKRSGSYFFPFLSTLLFRLSRIFPDKFFVFATSFLKKNQR